MTTLSFPETPLRLAFFGTPELAATILTHLLRHGTDPVVAVVCQPDKPRGRGKQVEAPPVKQVAEAHGLPVFQPVKLRDGVLRDHLKAERVDLAIVAAYGRILPPDLLEAPRFGCWNVHASLLPRHRGASPIQHAILTGDADSGLTLMQMDAGLDTGPMLLVDRFALAPHETSTTLSARMAELGGPLCLQGLAAARAGTLTVTPQDAARATLAPIIAKEAGRLDLRESAIALERRVRALDPWPGTWVVLPGGEPLKVLRAQVRPGPTDAEPGTILGGLQVSTGDGALELLEVLPAGKRAMSAADFLRGAGRTLTPGTRLG